MSTNRRVIVAGGGQVGVHTAELLHERGHTVVLIERNSSVSAAIGDEHVATVINGDATRPSVLEQAEPEAADAIAALTGTPGTNLAVCLLARRLNPELYTLVRTTHRDQTEYTEHVDGVVLTPECVADRAVDLLVGGDVRTFAGDHGGFEVLDLVVTEGASVAEHALSEVTLPDDCRVVAGLTTGELASPELTFEPGERYLVAVASDAVEDVRMLFQE